MGLLNKVLSLVGKTPQQPQQPPPIRVTIQAPCGGKDFDLLNEICRFLNQLRMELEVEVQKEKNVLKAADLKDEHFRNYELLSMMMDYDDLRSQLFEGWRTGEMKKDLSDFVDRMEKKNPSMHAASETLKAQAPKNRMSFVIQYLGQRDKELVAQLEDLSASVEQRSTYAATLLRRRSLTSGMMEKTQYHSILVESFLKGELKHDLDGFVVRMENRFPELADRYKRSVVEYAKSLMRMQQTQAQQPQIKRQKAPND